VDDVIDILDRSADEPDDFLEAVQHALSQIVVRGGRLRVEETPLLFLDEDGVRKRSAHINGYAHDFSS